MNLRDIAIKAGRNTVAAAYMPVKAGVDATRSVASQIYNPYAPSNLIRQFKYQTGLNIVEGLFKSSREALWGKDQKTKTDPTTGEKKDDPVLLEVKNTNSLLTRVLSILSATHDVTKSLLGVEIKAANDNKARKFDDLEKYREGKNANFLLGGAANNNMKASNDNKPSIVDDLAVGAGASIASKIGIGAIGGMIGTAVLGALSRIFNVKALTSVFTKTGLVGRIVGGLSSAIGRAASMVMGSTTLYYIFDRLKTAATVVGNISRALLGSVGRLFNSASLIIAFKGMGLVTDTLSKIGRGLLAGVGSIFGIGKLLPLLSKLAWPITIVSSIGAGIISGWNEYMETGDLAASISKGLTESLDFLTFGLFSAIKDAATNWITGGGVVSLNESNAKIDDARQKLINGEITQEQYDAAMKIHEQEIKDYNEFMAPVNNAIATEQLGVQPIIPPVMDGFGAPNTFSPEPRIFDPLSGPDGFGAPIVTPQPDPIETEKPPLRIILDGMKPEDPYYVVPAGTNSLYQDNVTAPAPTTPQQSTSPTIVNQNNVTNNNGGGGSGTQQYRHTPVSTTPNHQSKWENNWLTSD